MEKILCKIGIHKFTSWRKINYFSSNVVDIERRCKRCEKFQRKTVPK